MSGDLNKLFESIDKKGKGYLTICEIQQTYESVEFQWIEENYVHQAIMTLEDGKHDRVYPHQFGHVLKELYNLKRFEEEARWAFLGIADYERCVSVDNAFLLFQACQNENFSIEHWNHFLSSREDPTAPVTFDEMKFWLSAKPMGVPSSQEVLKAERRSIRDRKLDADVKKLKKYEKIEDDKSRELREEEDRCDYHNKTENVVNRKLNKWNNEGVTAFLNDDGTQWYSDSPQPVARHTIAPSDLLRLIDQKYDFIRAQVLRLMLQYDGDKSGDINYLVVQERNLRKTGKLKSKSDTLPGASAKLNFALNVVADDVGEIQREEEKKFVEEFNSLIAKGHSKFDALQEMKDQFRKTFPGTSTCGDFLVSLGDREAAEKADLLKRLKEQGPLSLMGDAKLVYFCQLKHQISRLRDNSKKHGLAVALIAMGLAEREQQFLGTTGERPFTRDSFRQEELSSVRIKSSGTSGSTRLELDRPGILPITAGRVDILEQVIDDLIRRYALEREAVVQYVSGNKSLNLMRTALEKVVGSSDRRLKQLQKRRAEWKKNSLNIRRRTRQVNQDILQEAVAIRWAMRIQTNKKNEFEGSTSILADVQEKQDEEFYNLCRHFIGLKDKELHAWHFEACQSSIAQNYDALSHVVVGSYDLTMEEEIIVRLVAKKYDAIRRKLFEQIHRVTIGNAEWDSLNKVKQDQAIQLLASQEMDLRDAGNFHEMAVLLGPLDKQLPSLEKLIGPSLRVTWDLRESHQRTLDNALLTGENVEVDYMTGYKESQADNLLSDLAARQEDEAEFVLQMITKINKTQMISMFFVQELWAIGEWDFAACALTVGLMERVFADSDEGITKEDKKRQLQLAICRFKARNADPDFIKRFVSEGEVKKKSDDSISLREEIWSEVHRKHMLERQFLIKMFEKPDMKEWVDAVSTDRSKYDRQARLVELEKQRSSLNFNDSEDVNENIDILDEAGAICYSLHEDAAKAEQKSGSRESITKEISVDLQMFQDAEVATLLKTVIDQDVKSLQDRLKAELALREKNIADNAFSAFTKYVGAGADDQLVKALNDKYDVLRDKLLMELLMKQIGEEEWARMSEKERQRRLMEMKLRERQLRREGNWEALAGLLNEDLANADRLNNLMGTSKDEYERRLRERLARRRMRGEDGDDSGIEEDEGQEELEEGLSVADMLADLDRRYEEEKRALLAQLHGRDGQFFSERERQMELLRLRREALKAAKEDDFTRAAMLMGILERQEAEDRDRLKGDRARQLELAKQRLERLRQQRKDKQTPVFKGKVDEKDPDGNILKLLETKHSQEEYFVSLWMDTNLNKDLIDVISTATTLELEERLSTMSQKLDSMAPSETKKRHELLLEAAHIKLRLAELDGLTDDDAKVALLAALQNHQNKECQRLLSNIEEWAPERLLQIQKQLVSDIDASLCDNASRLLLSLESLVGRESKGSDEQIQRALNDKYDAMRDQLLMEALMKQYGEAAWARMSEEERQRALAAMRLKERQLRREGRVEELAKLLGDALASKENLEAMLGRSREEQERRLKERLDRRKRRLEEGMSEEEVNRLDSEEEAQELAEAEKRRNNVLLDLDYQFEQEKEALFRRLQGITDGDEAEWARQQALTRLRRDQILARREQGLVAAAMVMSLASDSVHDDERQRQEELARLRIEAARAKRARGTVEEEKPPISPTEANPGVLRRAILENTERRHELERDVLVSLMDSVKKNPDLMTKIKDREVADLEKSLSLLAKDIADWQRLPAKDELAFKELMVEALAVNMAIKMKKGECADESSAEVSVVVDLQHLQLDETQELVKQLDGKTATELHTIHAAQQESHSDARDNVVKAVFVGVHTSESDVASLVSALDDKYDAMRDKMLLEALMKQVGEAQWAAMSEQERQAKLFQLKRQARRLEIEGRRDEASELLEKLLANSGDLKAKISESMAEQKARLDARRKQLREAKLKAGEKVNESEINQQIEEEEEARKRRSVLDQLEHDYDAEKNALMASLDAQGSRKERERQRQLQLMRLKQQTRSLALEESDTAALLLMAAAAQDKMISSDVSNERDRQRRIALERLEAAKRRREAGGAPEGAVQESTQPLELLDKEGLQLEVASAIECRQNGERQILINACDKWLNAESAVLEKDVNLTPEELTNAIVSLHSSFESLKSQTSLVRVADLSEKERKDYKAKVATEAAERKRILEDAVKCHLALEIQKKRGSNEEAGVGLISSLQIRQNDEMNSMTEQLISLKRNAVEDLVNAERQGLSENWCISLAGLLFDPEVRSLLDATAELQQLANKSSEAMDEMLKKKKDVQQREWKAGEEVDKEKLLKEIEKQYKRQLETIEKERQKALSRLQEKRKERSQAALESNTALALVLASGEQGQKISSQIQSSRKLQSEAIRTRLDARRAKRKIVQETERPDSQERPGSNETDSPASSAGPHPRARKVAIASEEEQKEIADRLLDIQTERIRKISQQQAIHQANVEDRVQQRKQARQSQTLLVLEKGKQQMKVLEDKMQDEKERQRQLQQDRINRKKYERTQTRIAAEKRKFSESASGQQAEDERKMEEMAAMLQSRFKKEEAAVKSGTKSTNIFDDDGGTGATATATATPTTSFDNDVLDEARVNAPVANEREMLAKIKLMRAQKREQKKRKQ